jgi:hypothetical protein
MKRAARLLAGAAIVAGTLSLATALSGFTAITRDPGHAEIVTADVTRFWRAFDDAAKVPMAERLSVYRQEYLAPATQGLKDFMAYRHVTAASLTQHVEAGRTYYSQVRPYVGQVVGQKPVIAAAFRRLQALYPPIMFPRHVYFVVGEQHGAGMNSPDGIILAAEMLATPPGTPYSYNKVNPDYVPFSIVHETIHFNQTFQQGDHDTLLEDVINEGTADFIASLTLPDPAPRQSTDRWHYGCAHEAELAARFAREAGMKGTGPWLFNHHPDTGWPIDMGYWLGYRIAQAFYDRSANKRAALHELLQVTDFKQLLAASHYLQSRPACVEERPAVSGSAG